MKKLLGKLVPHTLTIQQKLDPTQVSQQNKTDFLCRFITMDETWIYHHDLFQYISLIDLYMGKSKNQMGFKFVLYYMYVK